MHTLNSPFPVRMVYFGSIWISISNPVWLSFIWLEYYYVHFNHRFWFDSYFMIQLDSSYLMRFNSEFPIQFDLVILFDSIHTAKIWITVSDLTQLFKFKSSHNFLFNYTQLIIPDLSALWESLKIIHSNKERLSYSSYRRWEDQSIVSADGRGVVGPMNAHFSSLKIMLEKTGIMGFLFIL